MNAEPEVVDAEVVDEPGHEMERRPQTSMAQSHELTIDELVAQVEKVHQAMKRVMREDEHYGTIPGTPKPTLLKPGAEKLLVLFRLAPYYKHVTTWHDDGHLTVLSVCTLHHITTDVTVSQGSAICSTKEAKYAYRIAMRKCPDCGAEAIVKRKKEKGGGFICIGNEKGGCWHKFSDTEPRILDQETGRVANPDLADSYNTIIKMADKRALIAAVLNGTAASDIFTQDVDARDEAADVTESTPAATGNTEPSAPVETSPSTEGAAPSQETLAEDPSAASGDLPESSHMLTLIHNAFESNILKLGEALRYASKAALEVGAKPPTKKADFTEHTHPEVLFAVVDKANLEERAR